MNTAKEISQLKDQIIQNYKEQVELLKSINDSNDKIIAKYKDYQKGSEVYIKMLKEQINNLQDLLILSA